MIGAGFTAESAFGTLDKQWVPMTINYRQLVITKNNRLEFSDYIGIFSDHDAVK